MGIAALRRVTDLFIEGTEMVVAPGDEKTGVPPVIMWVNKLNAFEAEEARREGQVARSRMALSLKVVGSSEKDLFDASVVSVTREQMIQALVDNNETNTFIKAVEDIRLDPEWKERLEVNERTREQLAGRSDDDPEVMLLLKINEDYAADLQKRQEKQAKEFREELSSVPMDDLQERYRQAWVDTRGSAAFQREYIRAQVFYALRNCAATKRDENGRWDHSSCNHMERSLDYINEVSQLPQGLLDHIRATIDLLSVSATDARFSVGATSSSESAPSPSQEEESTPSTPEVQSSALVTTSS